MEDFLLPLPTTIKTKKLFPWSAPIHLDEFERQHPNLTLPEQRGQTNSGAERTKFLPLSYSSAFFDFCLSFKKLLAVCSNRNAQPAQSVRRRGGNRNGFFDFTGLFPAEVAQSPEIRRRQARRWDYSRGNRVKMGLSATPSDFRLSAA